MKIFIQEIRKLLESKLKSLNFTAKEAHLIADEFVTGELKGKRSHGVFGFIRAFRNLKKEKRRSFRVTKNRPAYAYINGNNDVGQLVAQYAIDLAITKAKKMGIAMVGGGNIHAFLRPGTWAEQAAKKGMVALCFNYGGQPLMAPTGAREAILSTNPIGLGIPNKPFPLVIDMAVSKKAFYYVRMARALGTRINKEWGIDKFGKPTADPNKLVAVVPFGGYKGYALGLAFEILTGPLVRSAVGLSRKNDGRRGFLFIVIDPLAFTSRKEFTQDVKKLIKDVKTAKRVKGVKEIMIPGEHAYYNEQATLRHGYVDIDPRILKEIKAL